MFGNTIITQALGIPVIDSIVTQNLLYITTNKILINSLGTSNPFLSHCTN
jgi:hypothetical protein